MLGILFLSTWLFVRFYLEDYTREQLIEAFTENTHGLYKIEIEDVDINLLTSSFDIEGLKISADSSKWDAKTVDTMKFSFGLTLEDLEVSKVHWLKFIETDTLAIDKIKFSQGGLELYEEKETVSQQNFLYELPKVIKVFSPHFHVNQLMIEQIGVQIHSLDSSRSSIYKTSIQKVNAEFYAFDIQQHTSFENATLFYSDSCFIVSREVNYEDVENSLKADNIRFTTKDSVLQVNNASFYIQGDSGNFPSFKIINLNTKQMMLNNVFIADVFAIQYDRLQFTKPRVGGIENNLEGYKTKIYNDITQFVPKLHLGVLDIYGNHLQVGGTSSQKSSFQADSVSLAFFNLNIDTAIVPEKDKHVLFSERVMLSFANVRSSTMGGGNIMAKKVGCVVNRLDNIPI